IILGVLDLSNHEIEAPETVATRIRRALPFVSPERLIIAPDCGLKYLPRAVAFGKMQTMVAGAALVRSELNSHLQSLGFPLGQWKMPSYSFQSRNTPYNPVHILMWDVHVSSS